MPYCTAELLLQGYAPHSAYNMVFAPILLIVVTFSGLCACRPSWSEGLGSLSVLPNIEPFSSTCLARLMAQVCNSFSFHNCLAGFATTTTMALVWERTGTGRYSGVLTDLSGCMRQPFPSRAFHLAHTRGDEACQRSE